MEALGYIAALAVFVLAVYLVNRFNQGVVNHAVAQGDDVIKKFAADMGLQYEPKSPAKDGDIVMDMGGRIYGEYNGLPVEIVMSNTTRRGPSGRSFESTMQRTLSVKIKNPRHKQFHITPKNENIVTTETPSETFNQNLTYTGDAVVPKETLDYFGKMGWMDLALANDEILFHDTFYDQFRGIKSMQAMTATHPVWGSSAGNPQVDVGRVRQFLDHITEFARKTQLT